MIKKYFILILILLSSYMLHSQELSIQTGHSATINDLKYSPDNKYLFSVGSDNKVIIWDMTTMKQMRLLQGHFKAVNAIAVRPNKKQFATASDDGQIIIWEYPSGKKIETILIGKPVKSLDFSPSGDSLVYASDSAYILDLKSKIKQTFPIKARKFFTTVKFSKYGNYVCLGGKNEHHSYIFNVAYLYLINKFRSQSNKLLFNDKEDIIYSAGNNGSLKIRPVKKNSKQKKASLNANNSWDAFTDISLTSKYLIAANYDKNIYIFDKKTLSRKKILSVLDDVPTAVACSKDGKFLAVASKNKEIYIWDLSKFSLVKILRGGANSITSMNFSTDGNFMFLTYSNGSSRIWNLQNKGQMLFFDVPKLNLWDKYFDHNYSAKQSFYHTNPEKEFILEDLNKINRKTDAVSLSKQQIFLWNIKNFGKIQQIKNNKSSGYLKFFLADTNKIITLKFEATHSQQYSLLGKEKILDRQTVFSVDVYSYRFDKKINRKKFPIKKLFAQKLFTINGDVFYANISPDGEFLIDFRHTKYGDLYDVYDLTIPELINTFELPENFNEAGFSPNGNLFYIASKKNNIIKIYNTNDYSLVDSLSGQTPFSFASDMIYCAYTDSLRNLILYNLKSHKTVFKTKTFHQTDLSSIKFNLPYHYIATAGYDGLIKFWAITDGKPLVSLAAFGKNNFIYVSPDNYYYSTKGAMEYIGFILNNNLYTFEQFDIKYNRPDTVLSRLEYSSPEEIKLYKKAYLKRLKKMGYNKAIFNKDFNIPTINITNSEDIPAFTDQSTIQIDITTFDSLYYPAKINIKINGVPIFGTKGFNLHNKSEHKIEHNFNIKLSSGVNKIDISAVNSQGAESLKKTFYVNAQFPVSPTLYVFSIGISDYKNKDYSLQYAAKDATDFSNLMKKNKLFNNIKIYKFLNQDAVRSKILSIDTILRKTKPDDEVILFFAGHGLLDENFDYYLTTYDFDYADFFNTTMEYNEFTSLLDSIPARKKVIFIDACHSGEIDTDDETGENKNFENVNTSKRGENDRSLWSVEFGNTKELGSQSTFELMKTIFTDLREGSGTTIISSAGGKEFAFESSKIQNGVFTYVLLNAIKSKEADENKDGEIRLSELQNYVAQKVSELTKGRQNPTSRRENPDFDFIFWK